MRRKKKTEFAIFFVSAFVIKHFSDTVQYQSNGFLEKNRDTISKELVNVMRQSNLPICRTLMALDDAVPPQKKETTLDGRVKINAAKQLVKHTHTHFFFTGKSFEHHLCGQIHCLWCIALFSLVNMCVKHCLLPWSFWLFVHFDQCWRFFCNFVVVVDFCDIILIMICLSLFFLFLLSFRIQNQHRKKLVAKLKRFYWIHLHMQNILS